MMAWAAFFFAAFNDDSDRVTLMQMVSVWMVTWKVFCPRGH
jgi:hypothetical protein